MSILAHPAQKIESLKVSIDYDSHLEQASVLGLSGTYLIIGEDFLLVPGKTTCWEYVYTKRLLDTTLHYYVVGDRKSSHLLPNSNSQRRRE